MNTPDREPTPEDLIEQEIYRTYHPMTMKQAIHNTIWHMRKLEKEKVEETKDVHK